MSASLTENLDPCFGTSHASQQSMDDSRSELNLHFRTTFGEPFFGDQAVPGSDFDHIVLEGGEYFQIFSAQKALFADLHNNIKEPIKTR